MLMKKRYIINYYSRFMKILKLRFSYFKLINGCGENKFWEDSWIFIKLNVYKSADNIKSYYELEEKCVNDWMCIFQVLSSKGYKLHSAFIKKYDVSNGSSILAEIPYKQD